MLFPLDLKHEIKEDINQEIDGEIDEVQDDAISSDSDFETAQ